MTASEGSRFVTRRVEISAIRFTAETALDVQEFCTDGTGDEATVSFNYGFDKDAGVYHVWGEVYDYLHDTWIKVFEGQWIVRGTKGEYYPCDDETFMWKYEPV